MDSCILLRAGAGDDEERKFFIGGGFDGEGDFFADDAAHRTHHKRRVHDREHDRAALDEPFAADDGVAVAGLGLLGDEAILVGLLVDEFQRVNRLDVGEHFLKGIGVDKLGDANARADTEMMLAFGADVHGLFDDFAEEHFFALGTAHPEAFGDAFGFGELGAGFAGNLRHTLNCNWGKRLLTTMCDTQSKQV